MKVSKAVAQENRAAVIKAASSEMRKNGVGTVSMATIAATAGLTHGAIYSQFSNKTALASATIAYDFDIITVLLQEEGMTFTRYVQTYLSPQHRDFFPWGCPVAALAGEMDKLDPQVQSAFADGLVRNIDALAALIAADNLHVAAPVVLATLVGAMAMARAVKTANPVLSDAILNQTCAHLLGVARTDRRPPA